MQVGRERTSPEEAGGSCAPCMPRPGRLPKRIHPPRDQMVDLGALETKR